MKKVIVKERIAYRSVNDTTLSFDIYYPPAFNFKKNLPLVRPVNESPKEGY